MDPAREDLWAALRELGRGNAAGRTGAERLARVLRAAAGPRAVALLAPARTDGSWRMAGLVDAEGELCVGSGDPFVAGEADPTLGPDLERACATGDRPVHVRLDDSLAGLLSPRAHKPGDTALLLPLLRAGRAGAVLLAEPAGRAIDEVGLERCWLAANLAAVALAREDELEELRRTRADTRREMRQVARIQRLLLPSDDVRLRGFEVAARLDTFGLAGGDYYDYMPLTHYYRDDPEAAERDAFGAMVADVTGHGAAAAVEAAMLDALLRTYSGTPRQGPESVLTFVNRHFFTRRVRSHLITAFATVFDPETEQLHYASAGHPPALLKRTRRGGRIEWLEGGAGIPIGVLPDTVWEGASCPFERDDLLVLYTDGVIEAASPAGEEFGMERLEAAVRLSPNGAEEVLAGIRGAVARHQDGAAPRDDRTVVVVRRSAG